MAYANSFFTTSLSLTFFNPWLGQGRAWGGPEALLHPYPSNGSISPLGIPVAGMLGAPCQGGADRARPWRRLECKGLIKRKSKLESSVCSGEQFRRPGGAGRGWDEGNDWGGGPISSIPALIRCDLMRPSAAESRETFHVDIDNYSGKELSCFTGIYIQTQTVWSFIFFFFSCRWLSEVSRLFHREQDLCRTALCSNT